MHERNSIEELKILLEYLYENEPIEDIGKTLSRVNKIISSNIEVFRYFSESYLPEIYEESAEGKRFFFFLTANILKFAFFGLARAASEALILICQLGVDDLILSELIKIVTVYKLSEFIGITSDGSKFTFQGNTRKMIIDIQDVQVVDALSLLKMILDKETECTVNGLLKESTLYSAIQKLNIIIDKIDEFPFFEVARFPSFEPFLSEKVSFSPENSIKLFDFDYGAIQYEHEILNNFNIPLFPFVSASNISFTGNRINIKNTGFGTLPPCVVRVQIEESDFEIGELEAIMPSETSDLFIEDIEAFGAFLHDRKRNSNVRVIFSFRKFGHSYDLSVLSKLNGHWIDLIPNNLAELALPYELPLQHLSDKDFERLCYWIVEEGSDKQFKSVLWLNEEGGGERGRDVIAEEINSARSFVFQCKRVEKFHPSDIEEELTTFAKYISDDPTIKPDVYVLVLSSAITDKTKSKGDELAKLIGMEIEYWPKSKIDRIVRKHQFIQDRFWRLISR